MEKNWQSSLNWDNKQKNKYAHICTALRYGIPTYSAWAKYWAKGRDMNAYLLTLGFERHDDLIEKFSQCLVAGTMTLDDNLEQFIKDNSNGYLHTPSSEQIQEANIAQPHIEEKQQREPKALKEKKNTNKKQIELQEYTGMKFACIVSNPPYNNNINLQITTLAYNMLETAGQLVFLMPAKWQTRAIEKEVQFRQFITPHINKAIYYPITTDMFDIALPGGILAFSVIKDTIFENKQKTAYKNGELYYNSYSPILQDCYIDDTNDKVAEVKPLTESDFINTSIKYLKFRNKEDADLYDKAEQILNIRLSVRRTSP